MIGTLTHRWEGGKERGRQKERERETEREKGKITDTRDAYGAASLFADSFCSVSVDRATQPTARLLGRFRETGNAESRNVERLSFSLSRDSAVFPSSRFTNVYVPTTTTSRKQYVDHRRIKYTDGAVDEGKF